MADEHKIKNMALFSAESNSAASIDEGSLDKFREIAVRMFNTNVLSPKEMAFPAVGKFAAMMLSALDSYRTLYFVSVLKIDMTYVTLILALIGIYDVLNNPVMGMAYDRTRTRWGKARPWIVFGAVPYFASTAVMYSGAVFFGDRAGNDPQKIIFLFVILFLQETFSTIYGIPRNNLLTLQSVNPDDRIKVGLLDTYVGKSGSQLVFIVFIPLIELVNKGYLKVPMSYVYAFFGIFGSAVGAVGNIVMALNCKERIMLQKKPAPVSKTLFYVLKNKYQLRNFAADFAVSWWSNGGYSWDVVSQQEIFGGSIPTLLVFLANNILDPLSVTFIPFFKKHFKNNRTALLSLRVWDLFCSAGMIALCCPFIDKRIFVCAVSAFFWAVEAVNNGPANVFEGEITREINDYTEYMTGERPDGTINILTDLIKKITSPINAMLTVKLFRWSGYNPSLPMLPWAQNSKTVYKRVYFLYIGIGLFPNIVKAVPYFFYDLVGEKREKMYIAINERRALIASKSEEEQALEALGLQE